MSPTEILAQRVGELRAPGSSGTPASGHLPDPRSASGAETAARGPEAASGRRCHGAGRDGTKRGKGAAGWGRREDARGAGQPEYLAA